MATRHTQASLSDFTDDPRAAIALAEATDEPIVIREGRKARGVLLSPRSFSRLMAAQEYMDAVSAVRRAIDDPRPGVPLDEFKQEIRKRMAMRPRKTVSKARSTAA